LPQNLKLDIETLPQAEALAVGHYLGSIVGKAHARQLDEAALGAWAEEMRRNRLLTWTPLPGCGRRFWSSRVPMKRPISIIAGRGGRRSRFSSMRREGCGLVEALRNVFDGGAIFRAFLRARDS
jgi:hypothetical protein